MRTWSAIVMGILLAGAVALVVWKGGPPKPPALVAADAGADGDAGDNAAAADASDLDGGAPSTDDGGEPESTAHSDAGTTLLDGEAPPQLAAEAPKQVTFGVIVVAYRGAQAAPATITRTREEALALARQIAEEAKTDFKAALAKGDKGASMENAGRMPRGMLEPAPEFVLFSLAKGGVSDVVDTPRGFWIMQRIE